MILRSFPNIMQFGTSDCGVACLSMICKYYGKHVSLNQIKTISGESKEGLSFQELELTAEALGFSATASQVSLDVINLDYALPCILHWNQDHFVVLYKVKEKRGIRKYYISDPAIGLTTIEEKDFVKSWKQNRVLGFVLFVSPCDLFFSLENNTTRTRLRYKDKVKDFAKRYKWKIFQILLGLFFVGLIHLVFPYMSKLMVDAGIKERNGNLIGLILIAQLLLIFGKMSIEFVRARITLNVGTAISIQMISNFFSKLMTIPMINFESKQIGDIIQRIEDNKKIEGFITRNSVDLIFSVFSLLIFSFVLAFYSLYIFAVFLIGCILYFIWTSLFLKKRKKIDYSLFREQTKNRTSVFQILYGMAEIRQYNGKEEIKGIWEDTQNRIYDINCEKLKLEQKQKTGITLINEVKNTLITFVSALAVIKGEMSLGMMLSVQYILGQLNAPLSQISDFISQIQEVIFSMNRMSEIYELEDEKIANVTGCKALPQESEIHTIKVEKLSFKYSGISSPLVLKDISFEIPHGKTTAIVGASGSGKTTLLKILLGMYGSYSGSIRIGNNELKETDADEWRKRCGTVLQNGFVFSTTIEKNIAIGSAVCDRERIKKAVKLAAFDIVMENANMTFNTVVGYDGQGLSQGQIQRLLIARMFYKNPAYIFLDEATNSLDTYNEKIITDNLLNEFSGRTIIIVAHRLSTVKTADNIIVLKNGVIIEQGNHSALVAKKGEYYNLVRNQLELES